MSKIKSISIIHFIIRQYHKIKRYESRYEDGLLGKFRVEYEDGALSQKMCYKNAKAYANIFGGKIVDAF